MVKEHEVLNQLGEGERDAALGAALMYRDTDIHLKKMSQNHI